MSGVAQYPKIPNKQVKPKSSRKLLFILFLFFSAVLVILFFKSSISKIETIEIAGNHYVSAETIGQATRVHRGDQYFSVRTAAIEARLKQMPTVKSVRVTKTFPGRLHVLLQEYPEVAVELGADGKTNALLENGLSVPIASQQIIVNKPILSGWSAKDPLKAKLCSTLAAIPDRLLNDLSEIRPDPSKSYPGKIKIYTRSQFEVITTISFLPKKLAYMNTIIADENPGLITMLDADYYEPFEKSADANLSEGEDPAQTLE